MLGHGFLFAFLPEAMKKTTHGILLDRSKTFPKPPGIETFLDIDTVSYSYRYSSIYILHILQTIYYITLYYITYMQFLHVLEWVWVRCLIYIAKLFRANDCWDEVTNSKMSQSSDAVVSLVFPTFSLCNPAHTSAKRAQPAANDQVPHAEGWKTIRGQSFRKECKDC